MRARPSFGGPRHLAHTTRTRATEDRRGRESWSSGGCRLERGNDLMEVRKIADRLRRGRARGARVPRGLAPFRQSTCAGRPTGSLPGAGARDPRRRPATWRCRACVRGPDLGSELVAGTPRTTPATPHGSSTTSRSTSGASRSPGRRGALPDSRRRSASLLYVSLAATSRRSLRSFGLLLLRFRVAIAAAVTSRDGLPAAARRALLVPAHRQLGARARDPCLRCGVLTLDRGSRWTRRSGSSRSHVLSFTRDSTWIPVLAAGLVRSPLPLAPASDALRDGRRGRAPGAPALQARRSAPFCAVLVNHSGPSQRTRRGRSSRATIRTPLFELVRANVGFLAPRRVVHGASISSAGVLALFAASLWRTGDPAT